MSPGPKPTFVSSGILILPAVWPQQTWAENWGLCPFGGGGLGPHLTQCGWSPKRTKEFFLDHGAEIMLICQHRRLVYHEIKHVSVTL